VKKYLSKLTSTERRFVVGVFVVVFIVINVLFIWPRFKDWNSVKAQMTKAENKLRDYQKEIGQKPTYERLVRELENADSAVPPEDQATELLRTINTTAAQSGVRIDGNTRQPTVTNQFFLELAQSITAVGGEPEMVDFLYRISAGNSLIRVRALTLRPDPPRYQLNANMTVVASFQKKVAASPATKTAASPATKPAVTAAKNQPPTTKRQ
jgi:Tfp pilus assembly protein PilO